MVSYKSPQNITVRKTTSILGTLLALSGIVNHGIFEVLQGHIPTNGMFIEAIGKKHRYWIHGAEVAFTIIPNFLFTGIAAILVSLLAMIWSAKYLHKKNGVKTFFLLFIFMFLFGGGIGFLFIFLPTWGYATRINKDLSWWNKILSDNVKILFSKIWPYSLFLTSVMWLVIMELGIFGYVPGLNDPEIIMNIVMLLLLATLISTNTTFISAISTDLSSKN